MRKEACGHLRNGLMLYWRGLSKSPIQSQVSKHKQGTAFQEAVRGFIKRHSRKKIHTPMIPLEIQKAAEDMPSVSPVLGKIHTMSRDMETSPRDLVKIIMLDPTLTAQVLKLVNSSFYGLAQRVSSLSQAVVLLGINTVRNIALSTALLSTVFLRDRRSPIPPDAFWRHCLGTAVACKMLVRACGADSETSEQYFVAGMLHDIGKILFIRCDPVRYEQALSESTTYGVRLCFAEQALFGCTHMQAGAVLAQTWKLHSTLTEAIEHHHNPRSATSPIVAIGNNFCKQAGIGASGDTVVEEYAENAAAHLGLQHTLTEQFSHAILKEINRAVTFLRPAQEEASS